MIDSISPQVLVALVTALLTAAVTLISVYLANLSRRKIEEAKFVRQNESERKNLKRRKLEKLYLLFAKWDADMATLCYVFLRVHSGEAKEEEALMAAHKNQISDKDYLQRIKMMIDLYFPELNKSFNEVLDTRSNLYPYFSKSLPPSAITEDFIKTQMTFKKAGKEFTGRISEIAQAL